MAITRRDFNRLTLMGSATLASSSYNFFFPRPAVASRVEFQLANLSAQNFFTRLKQYTSAQERAGALSAILQGQSGVIDIPDNAADVIRNADAFLQRRDFTQRGTELSEVNGSTLSRLWSRQKLENVGINVGTCFVQPYEGDFTDAKLAGPFITAIHQALPILAKEDKLSPDEIASVLLPVRSLQDQDDDLIDWFARDGSASTAWWTASGKVRCEYRLQKEGPGGFGEIKITMEAERLPERNIAIKRDIIIAVRFPTRRQQAMLYGEKNIIV